MARPMVSQWTGFASEGSLRRRFEVVDSGRYDQVEHGVHVLAGRAQVLCGDTNSTNIETCLTYATGLHGHEYVHLFARRASSDYMSELKKEPHPMNLLPIEKSNSWCHFNSAIP